MLPYWRDVHDPVAALDGPSVKKAPEEDGDDAFPYKANFVQK